ncbi:MAG: DUF86 domain-containing protein [Candidatus Pacearchaeota archaeon]|jgi:uncharacterized protein with HEPN domain
MIKDDLIFISHILNSIKSIEEFCFNITSNEEFKNNRLVQSATIRELEIIGEASKNIKVSFKEEYPEVPWKKISGLRDKLIHHYFGLDTNMIWEVIKYDIPKLKEDLTKIQENFI